MTQPSPHSPSRPSTAPDFLLSRPTGSLRTQGVKELFSSAYDASTHIRNLMASAANSAADEVIVGCVPFALSDPAALVIPEKTWWSEGPLEPPAFFRGHDISDRINVSEVTTSATAEEHAEVVNAATHTILTTQLEKVVLARFADVHFAHPIDPLLVSARMIDLSANLDGYGMQLPEELGGSFFTGSSPEMLIKRHGAEFSAFPLAGSLPRSGNRVVDEAAADALLNSEKDLYEHRLVVQHYRRVLEPLSRELEIPETPEIHLTKEMIHLGTPIEGVLKDLDYSALDLALLLHPTPAVGGTPTEAAMGVISAAEPESRGMYAGFVGWCSANGDGEYMVAIRSADIAADGRTARTWAGGGIVGSSDPDAEAEETAAKMRTALRALNVPIELLSGLS